MGENPTWTSINWTLRYELELGKIHFIFEDESHISTVHSIY